MWTIDVMYNWPFSFLLFDSYVFFSFLSKKQGTLSWSSQRSQTFNNDGDEDDNGSKYGSSASISPVEASHQGTFVYYRWTFHFSLSMECRTST